MSTGLLIAFEGGDGAGKSTQVRMLAQALGETDPDREIVVTRQPGGTDLGRSIRQLLLHGGHVSPRAEALLFAADKAHHVDELIAPALRRGAIVITDRYLDSSVAYQGIGRALGADEVQRIQLWAVADTLPDLTVIVDLPASEGRLRRGESRDRLEAEDDSFHDPIRQHFVTMTQADPDRYLIVDGTQPAESIHRDVLARLRAALVAPADLPSVGSRNVPPDARGDVG